MSVGRLVGFLVLVVPALAAMAAIVLAPAYTKMLAARYEADCAKADLADMQALKAAYDKLLAEAPESEVFTKRLMQMQTSRVPRDTIVSTTGPGGVMPPGFVVPPRSPRPVAPSADNLTVRIAQKVQDTPTRRGLFLLSIGAMIGGVFIFASPTKYRSTKQT